MATRNGEQTVLTKATPKSESLRTTVPMSIVRQFGLKDGDRLKWELQAKDNRLLIIVEPSEN
jgi:bifunctional DNA-binding transcriptional regulator/antitoxin component of YhaV-PrlF toxin-antitoxin module